MTLDLGRGGWDDSIIDIIIDFAEVAIHTVLHARRVYPQDIFERRRKYGVPVWMSRHPELNEYICQVLLRSKLLMAEGILRKMVVCMFEEGGHRGRGQGQALVEKIVIDIGIEHENASANGNQEGEGHTARRSNSLHPITVIQEMEDKLRSAILQIAKSSAHLPLRHGCTFALHMEAHDHNRGRAETETETDEEHKGSTDGVSAIEAALRSGTWLLADSDMHMTVVETGRRQLVPIKSVRVDGLRLDVSAEMGDCHNMD